MYKGFMKTLHRLVGIWLVLVLSISLPVAAYAAEDEVETENSSEENAPETDSQEEVTVVPGNAARGIKKR